MPFFGIFCVSNRKVLFIELTILSPLIIYELIWLWCAHVEFKKIETRAKVKKQEIKG